MPDTTRSDIADVAADLCRRMAAHSPAMRLQVCLGAVLEIAGAALGILGPYCLKVLIDAFAADAAAGVILVLVVLFVVSWSGPAILSTVRAVYSTKVIDGMTEDMAAAALRGRLPESARARASDSGSALGLLERLPYSLTITVEGLIWRAAPVALQLCGSLWLISALIPVHYAVILALILAGYVLVTWLTAREHKRRSADAHLAIGAVSRETGDILRNARRVVFNGALDLEIWRLQDFYQTRNRANTRMMWSLAGMVFWQYGVVGAGLILLLSLGTLDVIGQRMTAGDFVLLQAYALRLAVPLGGIGFVLSQVPVALANIGDVLAMSRRTGEAGGGGTVSGEPARIVLDGVSFSYPDGQAALQNISLDIAPGSFTVIAGPNGSGKSTLAQIIAGILAPDQGQVLAGGKNISFVPPDQRHRHVLYVPQFITLFNRTLAANGLYPPSTLPEAELADLLTQWRFYEGGRRPDLTIPAGEQGERLSGGQLQKLELARVAGAGVPALILDESTSALDTESEAMVIRRLRQGGFHKRTLVMISHRLQTAAGADTVIFLGEGSVAARGTHAELLSAVPAYRKFWAG